MYGPQGQNPYPGQNPYQGQNQVQYANQIQGQHGPGYGNPGQLGQGQMQTYGNQAQGYTQMQNQGKGQAKGQCYQNQYQCHYGLGLPHPK